MSRGVDRTLYHVRMDHNPPEIIHPDTAERVHALQLLTGREPADLTAAAVELLRLQLIPSTKKTARKGTRKTS